MAFFVKVKRVFASLANGMLCVFSRKSISVPEGDSVGDARLLPEACLIKCDEQYREEAHDWADPLILRLAESGKSAKCMVFVGNDRLWCGCGNTITVVDSFKLRVLHQIPVFVRKMALVNELVSDGRSVWGVGRQLSCVMQWDAHSYSLTHVFNCNTIDPTDDVLTADPKMFDELFDHERRDKAPTISGSDDLATIRKRTEGFKVENDPMPVTAGNPFSQRGTRQTLRSSKFARPRPRVGNISADPNRRSIGSVRKRVLRRQQGSTRTTSLVLVGSALWVARGMGDIVIIDITEGECHGKVLARLATEDCEKFGNRSYHKLVLVAGEYVVSSQWLEPVDTPHKGDLLVPAEGGGGQRSLAASFNKPHMSAHQAITVWEAWNRHKIEQFMSRRAVMLLMEEADTV